MLEEREGEELREETVIETEDSGMDANRGRAESSIDDARVTRLRS